MHAVTEIEGEQKMMTKQSILASSLHRKATITFNTTQSLRTIIFNYANCEVALNTTQLVEHTGVRCRT